MMLPMLFTLLSFSCQPDKGVDSAVPQDSADLESPADIPPPVACELPPTMDTCHPDDLGLNTDDDGDGWIESEGDCNDMSPTVHPLATDVSVDGVDQNCDGLDGPDLDGDGLVDCDILDDADCDGVLSMLDCDDTRPFVWEDANGDGLCDGFCLGSYELATEDDVQAISHCIEIEESLRIQNADISGLNSLPLKRIGHGLTIEDNSQLIHLDGLSSLVSIDFLRIGNNPVLDNVDGLLNLASIGHGLRDIPSQSGRFSIGGNVALRHLNGLEGLKRISVDEPYSTAFSISGNDSLTNIHGLKNLTHIDADFYISGNASLADIDGLCNVQGITGYMTISNNDSLSHLDGLSGLNLIRQDIYIKENQSLCHLNGLQNVFRVGEGIVLEANPSLIDIQGFYNVDTIDGSLIMEYNTALCQSQIRGFLSGLSNEFLVVVNTCCNKEGC